jgi:hypothetical protein
VKSQILDLTPGLIREVIDQEARRGGVAATLVIGRSNGPRAVAARRRAAKRIVIMTGCSASRLARMWGTETRTITAALTEAASIAPYDFATVNRLREFHGAEVAQAIIDGRHADTNADLAAWRRLGRGGAA